MRESEELSSVAEVEAKLEEEPKVTARTVKQLRFGDRLKIHAALTHETRLKLLRTLEARNPLSFTELKKAYSLNPNTLAYHLKVLEYSGLLHSTYEKDPGKRQYSTYRITELGKEMLRIDDYTKWL